MFVAVRGAWARLEGSYQAPPQRKEREERKEYGEYPAHHGICPPIHGSNCTPTMRAARAMRRMRIAAVRLGMGVPYGLEQANSGHGCAVVLGGGDADSTTRINAL